MRFAGRHTRRYCSYVEQICLVSEAEVPPLAPVGRVVDKRGRPGLAACEEAAVFRLGGCQLVAVLV